MGSTLDRAAEALFPREGNGRIGNVKFFRGHNPVVTADQLAEQLLAATAQIEAGEAELVTDIDGDPT